MPVTVCANRYLAVYSGILTIVFMATVFMGLKKGPQNATFDEITVHRINVVEPDGTPRLILSNQAQFPGSSFHRQEIARPDRTGAGMLFVDDEGTEDGGLIFGGKKDAQGRGSSFGHLSFDQYNQDQTLTLDSSYEDGKRSSGITINDAPNAPLTPEIFAGYNRIHSMPEGPAREAAMTEYMRSYPKLSQRAYLGRTEDESVGLKLRDTHGKVSAALRVKADGTPTLEFMDESGKVTREMTGDSR